MLGGGGLKDNKTDGIVWELERLPNDGSFETASETRKLWPVRILS